MPRRSPFFFSTGTWQHVNPPDPHRVYVGTLSLACLVLRPCVVAPPTDRVRFCPRDFAPAILPRHACLRLILFCTCPPLCAGVLWPMPAWVWRGVRSVFFGGFFWCSLGTLGGCATGHACTMMGKSYGPIKACHQATSIQSLTNTHIYVALSLQGWDRPANQIAFLA